MTSPKSHRSWDRTKCPQTVHETKILPFFWSHSHSPIKYFYLTAVNFSSIVNWIIRSNLSFSWLLKANSRKIQYSLAIFVSTLFLILFYHHYFSQYTSLTAPCPPPKHAKHSLLLLLTYSGLIKIAKVTNSLVT